MNKHIKKLILLMMIMACLLAISTVCAETDNSTDAVSSVAGDSSNEPQSIDLVPQKLSTTYASGKNFKIKAMDGKTKKPAANVNILLKVYTGKKYKKVSLTTDSGGMAKYPASKLSIGKHKIIVSVKDTKKYSAKAKTGTVKISKAKLKISAPKMTSIYKQNKKFQVTVKNKESGKVMKGVKVLLKVFTGNKYKKYSLKTNKNGGVSINTKNLKKGTHKVTVNVKATSKIRKASAKSSIKTVDGSKHIKLKVNGHIFDVKLANTKAANELFSKLKKGDIKIRADEYGGFEKVGDLGFSLTANDKYISTSPGDIVLYDSNQISLFYKSNSWDYTRLGKVQKVTANELRNILGSGDVTLTLSIK